MKVNKKEHKLFIYGLFLDGNKEKHFSLARLGQAASLQKKIVENAEKVLSEDGSLQGYSWKDSDIDLTLDEAVLVKELIAELKEAAPSDFEKIEELKGLLNE